MRNKPLPGMMKYSPIKQKLSVKMPKSHPVTPPTKEQIKKSKGHFLSKLGYKVDRMRAKNPQWLNESLGLH